MSTDALAPVEFERVVEAFKNRPRRPVPDPSPRRPDVMTRSNYADEIERQLQEDGHRTWGFVIYRTCYNNTDEDWAEFLKRLRWRMEWTFDYYNGRDILDLFTLTVIDDREHLDGASTSTVRKYFRQWCITAPQSEQQQSASGGSEIRPRQSPRYRYAIQVDAASLQSVVYDAPAPPAPDPYKKGWVKLIKASWQAVLPPETLQDTYEPMGGVVQNDVGWMKVPYQQVMTEYYVLGRDRNSWVVNYRRPPFVMGWPYED
jgi:hypothetical protein